MIYNILLIIGIIMVFISTFVINKRIEEEKSIYNEIQKIQREMEDYVQSIEEIIKDLESLIDNSLNKINNTAVTQENTEIQLEQRQSNSTCIFTTKGKNNSDSDLHEEIVKLNDCGYTIDEIAKKLNKGKREIQIILNMKEKNNKLY